jgi:hypothetical protein
LDYNPLVLCSQASFYSRRAKAQAQNKQFKGILERCFGVFGRPWQFVVVIIWMP